MAPSLRTWWGVALLLLVGLLAFIAGAASAREVASIRLDPGRWHITSQLWLDGQEVPGVPDPTGAAPAASEAECITEDDAMRTPGEVLRSALAAVLQRPWHCSFGSVRGGADGHALDYRCRTPAGALAEGHARFQAGSPRGYRTEIEGRSHVVDKETGQPLDARIVPARALLEGRWQSDACTP